MSFNAIVSTDWLQEHLDDQKLIVLDASMTPVGTTSNVESTVLIPKSIRFDIKDAFSDATSRYSNTLLPENEFISNMRNLGISDDSIIVVYDSVGVYSSPRAYYMIKSFGHEQVYVLDGGLPAWINEERTVVGTHLVSQTKGNFSKRSNQSYFCDADDVLGFIEKKDRKIVDARSSNRFLGLEPEPRASLMSGHIPTSINLPYNQVLEGQAFKSAEALKTIFTDLSIGDQPLVFSCGSGITACIISMAAEIAGINDVLIYDGSWTEWGDVENAFPIEKE